MRMNRRTLLLAATGLLVGGPATFARVAEAGDLAQEGAEEAAISYGPPEWLRIPAIEVNSAIQTAGIKDGVYDAPAFDVGHHFDSAFPGEYGNTILNGHVETIGLGKVFNRLKDVEPGVAVYVYTPTHRTDWVVTHTFTVANTDDSFLYGTELPTLTLYTCTGTFYPESQDFSERLVAVASLVQVVERV